MRIYKTLIIVLDYSFKFRYKVYILYTLYNTTSVAVESGADTINNLGCHLKYIYII